MSEMKTIPFVLPNGKTVNLITYAYVEEQLSPVITDINEQLTNINSSLSEISGKLDNLTE